LSHLELILQQNFVRVNSTVSAECLYPVFRISEQESQTEF
jgi:hypothetical protein